MNRFIIALLLGWLSASAFATHPALTAFGHGNKKINGVPAGGTRPLLIILADTAPPDDTPNEDPLAHPPSYYFERTVGLVSFPSVNGFLLENSLGDFILTYAGTVDMIDRPGHDGMEYTAAERANWTMDTAQSRDARIYGDTINAAARTGHDFAQYDANNNNVIEQHELMVLIVTNHSNVDNGAARPANPAGLPVEGGPAIPPFIIEGTTKQFNSVVCEATHVVGFPTLAHEMMHLIGLEDLYGNGLNESSNFRQTLAGATINATPDTTDSFHLDPWHKLQFGWCEPQIMDMRTGGVATLQANQGNSPAKHLILYDSTRVAPGEPFVREFFILEYRTRASGGFSGYDAQTNDNGLVIWHVHHDANGNRTVVPTPYVRGDSDTNTPGFQLGMMGGVFTLAPPLLAIGGGSGGPPNLGGAWHSGTTTPKLRWTIFPGANPQDYSNTDYEGTESVAHIGVRPFATGAAAITVEVFTSSETWVDFFYGGLENGGQFTPYNTFVEGLEYVGWGGKLRLKTSASVTSPITILDKPMTITAEAGPVTIREP